MSLVFILLLYVHLKQQDNSITCSLFYNSKCIIKFLKFFEVYNSFYYIIIQWYKFCLSVGFACNTFFPKDILFLKTCFFFFLSPPPNLEYKSHFLCFSWKIAKLCNVIVPYCMLRSIRDSWTRFKDSFDHLYRSLIKVFSSRQIWDSYFG